MKKHTRQLRILVFIMIFVSMFFFSKSLYAHCDTLEGPVVESARKALVSGDITPLLKWVAADDEQIIRTAFQKTLEVRKLGTEARDLADMYFFETLVRIHRTGEGAPYTGLKSGKTIDPAVVLADKALESGSVDHLVNILTDATEKGIRERFHRTLEAKKHAEENVTAGREFVKTYVVFTHYVEGLHGLIKGGITNHEHE